MAVRTCRKNLRIVKHWCQQKEKKQVSLLMYHHANVVMFDAQLSIYSPIPERNRVTQFLTFSD